MARQDELIGHLRSVPLFSACTQADMKAISRHILEVKIAQGTAVFNEGTDGDHLFVILSGTATVTRRQGRKAVEVGTLGAGRWFGELALIDPAPRNATITARTEMTLGTLSARTLRTLFKDLPTLADRLLVGMARRLRDADLQLSQDDAPPQVAWTSTRSVSSRKPTSKKPAAKKPAAKKPAAKKATAKKPAAKKATEKKATPKKPAPKTKPAPKKQPAARRASSAGRRKRA